MAKIDEIYELLDAAYLPRIEFIEARSTFEHLIAVILSAQTTDRQVNQILPELFARYPNPGDFAAAQLSDVEHIIHSVGFYRVKAKHIIAAAQAVHERYHDQVPCEMEELLSIPGVGRKSAHVIRGARFHLPAVIVDTHFARVVRRLGLAAAADPEKIEYEIAEQLDDCRQYRFSMTVNLHGRDICHARKPKCTECMLLGICSRRGLPNALDDFPGIKEAAPPRS